jgi:hypothetical protein
MKHEPMNTAGDPPLNATGPNVSRHSTSSRNRSGGNLRLMKWLVLIVLLVLLLVALFLPDRALTAPDSHPPEGEISAIKAPVR